jgi:hypothetical protein
MRLLAISCFTLCTACNAGLDQNTTHRELVETHVDLQKGRYQLIPASQKFPPLFIDTATGCVRAMEIDPAGKLTFGQTTLGGNEDSSLDECNQHLFLHTDVVGPAQ